MMSKTEEMAPPVPVRDVADPPRIDERYRIEKEIGRGGMGRVFVAHDRKLGRDVAIKVLASGLHGEEALRRFEQEARATCALNHANILDVHDIGTHDGSPYIVSELLHGTTLRERLRKGPLSVSEASGFALQLAQGLSAAHEKGIVHRDLKPENLFITEEGRLKILDFGIAKLVAPMTLGTGETLPSPQPHTEDGAILGTVGYMSPEQVRGQPADRGSDVFSFGAIFYELLAGRSPFERDTAVETGYAILNDDPPPLPAGVPAALDRLIRRCLAKRPEDRFQSAHEPVDALADAARIERTEPATSLRGARLAAVLVGIGVLAAAPGVAWYFFVRKPSQPAPTAGAVATTASIAVLPFVNLSSDKENEYFSDGITEEILNALAQVDGLRVIGRTSSFSFKGKNEDLRSIGEKLDVAHLLEGSVRKEGNSVRVAAQLIEAAGGSRLWSQTYDRELRNVFSVEDELARAIVKALKAKLVPGAALVRQTTVSPEAHDLYLKGRFFWNQRTQEGVAKATSLFEQAIALDPRYALAHSGLADAYAFSAVYGGARWAEASAKAAAHALRAVELDDGLAEAHTSLGLVKKNEAYDWSGAERELKRAIELRPGYVNAHIWYSLVLWSVGRVPEGQAELELARQLEPTSFVIAANIANNFFDDHQWERAIEQSRKAIELFLRTGQFAEAQAALDAATAAVGPLEPLRAEVLATTGQHAEARRLLAVLERRPVIARFSSAEIAAAYLALGDKDSALAWIGKGLEERDSRLDSLKFSPLWDPIRPDPRFHALLRRMNLE